MKIFAVAIPLMIASSAIEKVSAGKPDEKPGASGATGFIAKGTTNIGDCAKFHINFIANLLPGEFLSGEENARGNFLFNCDGGDVCKVNINCIDTNTVDGVTTAIASGTVINECIGFGDVFAKGDNVYAGFRFGGGSTVDEFAYGVGGCTFVPGPDDWEELIGGLLWLG